ncbi:MAG: ASCH domain-containing protein [Bacilli bacterium]|jgi:ASC-1-like (ASCH) protein|nr:ASCH domain-containing protein [Bacilli bacterium]
MKYEMNLWNDSFEAIKSGCKTIEMRLNDDKRKLINPGDIIKFINAKTNEKIECLVLAKYQYRDFEELYKNHDKISIGYQANEEANPSDMLTYYKKEEIQKYGVLGIEVKVS